MELLPNKDRVEMSASAQLMLRDYAGHRWPTLNHKGRMARLATALGLGHRRIRSIYQNEFGVRLRADELQRIKALQGKAIEEANRNDFAALQARIDRLEAVLFQQDEEFHREQVVALRQATDDRRGNHVAGATDTTG